MGDYGEYSRGRTRKSQKPTGQTDDGEAPCRACSDFKSWMKTGGPIPNKTDCPLDRDELGRNSWAFLHTMAAYFPKKPSPEQQSGMVTFLKRFGDFYPCDHCAKDFRTEMEKTPPEVSSRDDLSKWMCDQHNLVNRKLGKKEFDCSKVLERWLSGPKDGSCG